MPVHVFDRRLFLPLISMAFLLGEFTKSDCGDVELENFSSKKTIAPCRATWEK
jgi:hypothetical protein